VTIIAAAQLPRVAAVASMNGGITWTEQGIQTGTPAVEGVWKREGPKIKAPVLLLHARGDKQINPELSYQLAKTLRKHGKSVELKLYPGQHDWFPEDELLRFLEKYINLSH
jgi:dienelactone hydrolase